MSDDFSWEDNDDDIVTQSVQGVAVYLNKRDNIVIRQERDHNSDEDTFVIITPDVAKKLVERLSAILESRHASHQ